MCGIVGIVDLTGAALDPALLKSMTDAIHYRGPDDEGYVLISQATSRHQAYSGPASPESVRSAFPPIVAAGGFAANIGLAHRRFSIIDLSAGGHQPLFSQDGTCCVVFNGEIYNYLELREQLAKLGVTFQSTSDTEVLLAAYRIWGTECFSRFNGFWAVALYDFSKRRLILSRDRLGKKPLYWTQFGSRLYFASEIKSLLRVPAVWNSRKVNEEAAWHWCVDGRRDLENSTLFDGIHSLPAACWTVVDQNFPNNIRTFWEVPRERLREADIPVPEAMRLVRETLDDAVRIRLRADVPLALELSGGLDSSTVLALAARHHPGRITTYTVKFPEPQWDEEPFARSVASRYNTDYRVLEPETGGFWQGIMAFTELQEEPYHSPNMQTSQVIWSLMRAAGTKVALTGAAGDEMFAGYARYYWKAQFENLGHGRLGRFVDNAVHWTERQHDLMALGGEMIGMLGLRPLVRRIKTAIPALENQEIRNLPTPARQYYAADLTAWLREEIVNTQIPYWLRSGEKNYMGMPFEARSPFLDYRVVEIATRMPTTYLIRHGWHKWILRKAMEDSLPADVVWRRVKMGFPYPYERFFATYRGIIDLILREARNPYIDFSRYERLRTDWNALSFILWYEFFINDNKSLFRNIEEMAAATERPVTLAYVPEYQKSAPCEKQFDRSAAVTDDNAERVLKAPMPMEVAMPVSQAGRVPDRQSGERPVPAGFDRLLYRNQFVLGPRFVDWLTGWTRYELSSSMRLSVHPDLSCCRVSAGGRSITLLGFILDPENAKASNEDIAGRLFEALKDCESLIEQTYKYGGRWILIVNDGTRQILFNDATGLRQVFYSNEQYGNGLWCASEPGMLARVLRLEIGADALDLINSYHFRTNPEYWWPGSGSPFKEISHLLPNHRLDLHTQQVRRYWPDRDLKERPMGEVVETASRMLTGLISSAAERFELAQSITAGWDSRLLLAASRHESHRIVYMTVRQWGMRESDADIRVPATLLRRLGLDHRIVRSGLIMDPEFIKTYKTNALLAHDHFVPDAQAILNSYGLGKVCVVGGVSELVRDPTVGSKRSVNGRITPAEVSSELYGLGRNRYAITEIEKWFAGLGQIHNLSRDTIFYWEQRAANWLAMNQVEFDSAWRDNFVPYNCRGLLMAMLAVREKDRLAPHHRLYQELIWKLWPEVLSEPVNPHKAGQLAIMNGKLRAQAKRWIMRVPQVRRRYEQGE